MWHKLWEVCRQAPVDCRRRATHRLVVFRPLTERQHHQHRDPTHTPAAFATRLSIDTMMPHITTEALTVAPVHTVGTLGRVTRMFNAQSILMIHRGLWFILRLIPRRPKVSTSTCVTIVQHAVIFALLRVVCSFYRLDYLLYRKLKFASCVLGYFDSHVSRSANLKNPLAYSCVEYSEATSGVYSRSLVFGHEHNLFLLYTLVALEDVFMMQSGFLSSEKSAHIFNAHSIPIHNFRVFAHRDQLLSRSCSLSEFIKLRTKDFRKLDFCE